MLLTCWTTILTTLGKRASNVFKCYLAHGENVAFGWWHLKVRIGCTKWEESWNKGNAQWVLRESRKVCRFYSLRLAWWHLRILFGQFHGKVTDLKFWTRKEVKDQWMKTTWAMRFYKLYGASMEIFKVRYSSATCISEYLLQWNKIKR